MAITPSGIDFFEIKEEDIVIMDLEGQVVEGEKLPSSEWYMHLIQYQQREDIDAVIHAHTTYGTVLAVLREPLPASHYMIAVAGKMFESQNTPHMGLRNWLKMLRRL